MMTTSRWSSIGARHCSTYARKIVPFIGPSITKGATIPSWRSPTTRVMVFQWPWGTDPTNRSPRGQRPRSLTKLVLVAVSSINTNLAGSSRPCLRIQRRRARATSARSCSLARRLFFDGDIMSLEKSPDRGATAWNSLLAHRRNDLIQGQIRLLGYQSQQPFHLLLQRRRTLSFALVLPLSRQRCNHLTAELALRLKLSAASRRDAPATTASITA